MTLTVKLEDGQKQPTSLLLVHSGVTIIQVFRHWGTTLGQGAEEDGDVEAGTVAVRVVALASVVVAVRVIVETVLVTVVIWVVPEVMVAVTGQVVTVS
jgi:hypothetical protein